MTRLIVGIDPVGPTSESIERAKIRIRWMRTWEWCSNPITADVMLLGAKTFECGLRMLGDLFATVGSKDSAATILPFVHHSTSPAEKLIREITVDMRHPDRNEWALCWPWAPATTHNVATALWTFLGEVFMRCVDPFNQWPFLLGVIPHILSTANEKPAVARKVWSIRRCCTPRSDGVTYPFRMLQSSVDQVTSPESKRMVLDVFRNVAPYKYNNRGSARPSPTTYCLRCWPLAVTKHTGIRSHVGGISDIVFRRVDVMG